MREAGKYCGSNFSEETLKALLTTPAPIKTSESVVWGQREHLLGVAREVLDALYISSTAGQRDHVNDPRQRNPWQEFQPLLVECAASLQTDPRDNRSPAEVSLQMMRLLNPFLRQALIYVNLKVEVIEEHDKSKARALVLTMIGAGKRLKKVLEEDVAQKPGVPLAVPLILGIVVDRMTANFEALEEQIKAGLLRQAQSVFV
ncbi:hypothetical protein JCM10296v2_000915 [Rhodotorula toruloides]